MQALRMIAGLILPVVVLAIIGLAALWLWAREPEIAALPPGRQADFPPEQVAQGARLAALGDCDVCHTTPGGAAYAGSRPIPTPFGVVYSTNITPDPTTGIGQWSEDAFRRALRRGVARRGTHLYPAFPYDHYTKLSDEDIHALYAFVMTRAPVDSRSPPAELPFPLNIRRGMAAWNLLYLDRKPFEPDPRQSAQWNRGAYLVEGLGHCGDCHTPRNRLGAEERDHPLAGGRSGGWEAPPLTAATPAPIAWTAEQLFGYLRHGWDPVHGAAAGPMQPVTHDLGRAPPEDVQAIAAYLAPAMEKHPPPQTAAGQTGTPAGEVDLGATLFAGACAGCHEPVITPAPPAGIDLAHSTMLNAATPNDAIFVIERGIRPPDGHAGPFMPPFAGSFTRPQTAALLGYLRSRYSRGGPWAGLEQQIAALEHPSQGEAPHEDPP